MRRPSAVAPRVLSLTDSGFSRQFFPFERDVGVAGPKHRRPRECRGRPGCGSSSLLHRQVNGASRMTQDDVLFGYRLQLFALAGQTTVTQACRTFGVHRSTYYAWKAQVDRQELEMLRPRERRRPVMPNQLSPVIEQRIVAFSLGHTGL